MKSDDLYIDIMSMLTVIQDDEKKLLAVLNFMENQVLKEGESNKNFELPEKYRSTILQITAALEEGFVCYLNPDTLEIEQVENRGIFDTEEYEEQNDDMLDEFGVNYMKWDDYIKFEPMDRNDVLLLMQKFVTQLNDTDLSKKLESVLGEDMPLTKFKRIIEHSNKKDAWASYLNVAYIDYVKTRLLNELRLR